MKSFTLADSFVLMTSLCLMLAGWTAVEFLSYEHQDNLFGVVSFFFILSPVVIQILPRAIAIATWIFSAWGILVGCRIAGYPRFTGEILAFFAVWGFVAGYVVVSNRFGAASRHGGSQLMSPFRETGRD